MIVVYSKITKKELQLSVEETINKIETWFKQNPKRRTCKAQLWYGKIAKIRRNYVRSDVESQTSTTETAD